MRVLIVQPWVKMGGAELISAELAFNLEKLGHSASIACTFADLSNMPGQSNQVRYLLPPSWLSRLFQKSRLAFLLFGALVLSSLVWKYSKEVDLINPHNFPSSWIAAIIGALRRKKVLWTCNEPPERVGVREALKVGIGDFIGWSLASSWIDKAMVGGVHLIHVPSVRTRRDVLRRYGRDSVVIHTTTDPDYFDNPDGSDFVKKLGFEGQFVLLCVGKLHPQKNQILCIEVMRELLREIPEARLILVGDGPMKDEWRRKAQEWAIDHRVQFRGNVNGDELRDLYGACSVNLLPAINQSWGLTPLEALCMGRISIVSDQCVVADLLRTEGIGVVCAPNRDAFARELLQVYSEPLAAKSMAKRGREFVESHLRHEVLARRLADHMYLMLADEITTSNSSRPVSAR